MGCDMHLRDLYLPADGTVDLAAAKTTASDLCRNATMEDLRILLDEDWISHDQLADPDDWTDQALTAQVEALRAAAQHKLHQLLDRFAASLQGRDVAQLRFDNPTDSGASVDAYFTGGLSAGDAATEAYAAWDIVFDTDRFPHGWCDQLGAACGLLHPHRDGPLAALVMFHRWAWPAAGQAVDS